MLLMSEPKGNRQVPQHEKKQSLVDPTSPTRLALYSYVLFLVAWLFPPQVYTSIIREPDLMFLDPQLFFFFTLCTLAFVIGVRSVKWFVRAGSERKITHKVPTIWVLCAPTIVCAIWALLYLSDIGAHIDLAAILFSQQGALIKNSSSLSSVRFEISIPFLVASLWWSFSKFYQQEQYSQFERIFFWSTFAIGFLISALVCVSIVDRTTIMPLIFGTLILFIHRRYVIGKLNRKKLLIVSVIIAVGVLAIFSAFSYLRGFNSSDLILWTVVGYSIATYNRMSAVLSGLIPAAFPGQPIHLIYYVLESYHPNNVFQFREALGWPDAVTLWNLEFPIVSSHGLNGNFIWLGFFGYIFTDIGWFTPAYIYAVGFLTGWMWMSFVRGNILGQLLYPWLGFGIIFWIGWGLEFSENFFYFLEAAAFFWLYEQLMFKRKSVTLQ